MSTVNLNNEGINIITGNDNIVIVDCFRTIRGGRSLDVAGFAPDEIKAGHVIIKDNSNPAEYKPMPVTVAGKIVEFGKLVPGSGYTNNGTYTNVSLTGGSGSGAKATIVVTGNAVSSVTITDPGTGYKDGDVLSAAAANIGTSGSGFAITVTVVDDTATGYASLPANHTYEGVLRATILKSKPYAAIMYDGTVNPAVTPFSMTSILSAFKTAVPTIEWRQD
jgi:hypothetical protein